MLRPFIIFTITSLLASVSHAALSLQSYDADSHHRFADPVDPTDFIGNDYNWSGVARASNGRWVTMISATYFITANHAAPGIGNTVSFHADNDPSGTPITRTVDSKVRIGGTDIAIGRLSSAPGPTISIYGIASNTATSATFGSSAYNDREAFIVGKNDDTLSTQSFRVGRNELDGFYDNIAVIGLETISGSLTGIGDAIAFADDRATLQSLGADEAYLEIGDSGAPMFVTSGTDLILVGTNWFKDSAPDPNNSAATFLPNYITEIAAIVEGGGESLTLVSVPEPSSMLLLTFGGFALLKRRR